MRTHLWMPGTKIGLTLCGRKLKHFGTNDPSIVDCKVCSGAYQNNVEWFAHLTKNVEEEMGYRRSDISYEDFEKVVEKTLDINMHHWQKGLLMQFYVNTGADPNKLF